MRMPRFLMVVHRLELIGSMHRCAPESRFPLGHEAQLPGSTSSAIPSVTRNSTFCGVLAERPFPGVGMMVLIAGNIESKSVPRSAFSLLWFTVISPICDAAVPALDRFELGPPPPLGNTWFAA